MANNDLQALYKMRDILKREQYVKSYNQNVNQNLINAVNSTIPNQVNKKNNAYNQYLNTRDKRLKINKFYNVAKPAIIFLSVLVVLIILALINSSDIPRTLTYILCTAVMTEILFASIEKGDDKGDVYIINFSLAIIIAIVAIICAAASGVSGFWGWIGAIFVFLLWPVSNFFVLGPVVWLSILSLIALPITYLLANVLCDTKNIEKIELRTDNSVDVQRAKVVFDEAYQEYSVAYNEQHSKIKGSYQKMMKPDTYTSDKKAMQDIIPANLQTLDMINKLIWCIEQKYAYDIVSARNWYVQQEHNADMQAKMQAVANQVSEVKRVQEQAVADAAIAHREAMAAIEKQTDAINRQTISVNKQLDANINAVNQAAASVSNSVDRAARSVSQSVDAAGRDVSSSIDRL